MPQRPVSDSGDDHHDAMQQAFRWQVPARFNMAEVCSRRWAQAPDAIEKIAIIEHVAGAAPRLHSYAALQAAANAGQVCVIVARRVDLNRPGHITAVVPETPAASAVRSAQHEVLRPLESQAGTRNVLRAPPASAWWQG